MAIRAKTLKKRARTLMGAGVQATKRGARKARQVVAERPGTAQAAAAGLAALVLAAKAAKRAMVRPEVRKGIAGARVVAGTAGKAAAAAAITVVLEMAQRELQRRSRR
jgi:hypothetical protein